MAKDVQDALLKQLKNPFDEKFVKWRVGATNAEKTKGIALAFIDSREVMKRFDEVCGIDGWQSKFTAIDGGFICEISVKIGDAWITKSNAAGNTHVEPIKGGASDAFKRAASTWGVGRYLYYLPNVWVEIVAKGKSYVLAQTPELPDWAKHNDRLQNWEDIAEMQKDMGTADEIEEAVGSVLTSLEKVNTAKTTDGLSKLVEELSPEDRAALTEHISAKTKELLKRENKQTKTEVENGNGTADPNSGTSAPAKQ